MFEGSTQGEIKRSDEINVRDYLRVLRKRRSLFIVFFLFVLGVALAATFFQTPLYQATTQLLIEKSTPVTLRTQYGYQHDPFFLNTQFELVKSKSVLYRVIDNLKLATTYRGSFLDDTPRGGLSTTIKAALASMFKARDAASGSPGGSAGASQEPTAAEQIARQLIENIEVQPIRETNVINVSYKHKDPLIAQLVVNAIANSYMAELLDIKIHNSNVAVEWMAEKAREEKQKLEQSEAKLQEYTRKYDLVTIEDKLAVIPEQLTDYSGQLARARAKRKELEEVHGQVEGLNHDYKHLESLSVFTGNKDLQQIREKILQVEQREKDLSKKYGFKHPAMVKIKEELQLLVREKKSTIDRFVTSIKNEYELAVKNETNLEQLLDSTKQQLLEMNEKLIAHNILKREVDSNRVLYEALLAQMKETSATEQTQTVNVFIAEKAEVPERPAEPKKARNIALAVIFGLFGGIVLVFFVEYLDNTITTVKQIESRYGLPVVGVVRLVQGRDILFTRVENVEQKMSLIESYRMIRSEVVLSSPGNLPKSLLVTSGLAGEGKTSTCFNLAEIIALEGKSVVVIDCDLRRPGVHEMVRVGNEVGLSSYLSGVTKEKVIVRAPDSGVAIMSAGPLPPNPTELLGSKQMKALLEELAGQFDCILLDSPPVLFFADAQVLSTMVDAALLVVWSGRTTREEMDTLVTKVARVGMKVLGVVLNGKDVKKDRDGFAGGYYSGAGYRR